MFVVQQVVYTGEAKAAKDTLRVIYYIHHLDKCEIALSLASISYWLISNEIFLVPCVIWEDQ